MFRGDLLGGFGDLTGLNAICADFHPTRSASWDLDANGLEVGIESAGRTIVCMRNIVPKLRTFIAHFATFSHYLLNLRWVKELT